MLRAMFSGQSGLKNFQTQLDVIGNNISNVNTVGYKTSRVTFQNTLSQTLSESRGASGQFGGINPTQVGLGSKIASIDKIMTQGSLQNTGNKTDMAIKGDGFFVLSDGLTKYFSRAGNFTLDSEGHFVNPSSGMKLQGWNAKITETGKRYIDSNEPIQDITISPNLVMEARETTFLNLADNLNSDVGIKETTMTIKSSSGDVVPVKFTFERIMSEQYKDRIVYRWHAQSIDPDKNYTLLGGSNYGEVELDEVGNVLRWSNYPGHVVRANATNDFNSSYPADSRIDIGKNGIDWPLRAYGDISVTDSNGNPVTLSSQDSTRDSRPDIAIYRDATNPNQVTIQVTDSGGTQYTGTISTDGTFYDLNRNFAQGVTLTDSGGNEITLKNLILDSGVSESVALLPVGSTNALSIELYQSSSDDATEWGLDGIYMTDTKGELIPKYQDEDNRLQLTDGTNTRNVKFLGGISLKDSQNNEVYYDPRDISFSVDNNGNVTITLKVEESGSLKTVTFTDADGDSASADTVEEFNAKMESGWKSTDGKYTIAGLSVIEANATDTFVATTGNTAGETSEDGTVRYIAARKIIQTPVSGELRLIDTENSQNYKIAEYENPNVVISTKIYDSLGNDYDINIKYTKIADNTWYWKAETVDGQPLYKITEDGTTTSDPAEGVIAFDGKGQYLSSRWRLDSVGYVDYDTSDGNNGAIGFWFDPASTGESPNERVAPSSVAAAGPVKVSLNMYDLTQFAAPNSVNIADQDGNAKGVLQNFTINDLGEVLGIFSNGKSDLIAQVAVAKFTNPGGLLDVGNSMFMQSDNSGIAKIGSFGEEGAGTLVSGALEMSNVDLSEEFTKMITAQRGFQAAARVITTSDQILTELVNLKR
ncbi:flagellar hook-basal body protein [Marinitoga piezophila KA3]|uniref:Flagellar hook protein FlgE n=1 Tax=Marinitoga piezophila (strain DSM 14283 / JCM 11233 / KA3) TaxID=443254 RepID=H2J6D8_MARPK|nr:MULTISPECIES: flagellar hook-basal body complex protein [Marinitoga]AEX86286.1 flagellar hook-basal body protein [Marinitoga piezophila KA3]